MRARKPNSLLFLCVVHEHRRVLQDPVVATGAENGIGRTEPICQRAMWRQSAPEVNTVPTDAHLYLGAMLVEKRCRL